MNENLQDTEVLIETRQDVDKTQQRFYCTDKEREMFKAILADPYQIAYMKFWFFSQYRLGMVPLWFKDQYDTGKRQPEEFLCPADRPGGPTEEERERYTARSPKCH